MNQGNLKKSIWNILEDHTWKGPAISGGVALLVAILLDSFLFAAILTLIKLTLWIGGLVLLGYAAYLAYPIILKKIQSR